MKKFLLKVISTLALITLASGKINFSFCAVFTWNAGSGNWNNASLWTVTGAPTLSTWPGEVAAMEDTVIINATGTVTINVSFNNTSVKDVTINSGTVVANAVTAVINGDLLVANGATFQLGAITLTVVGNTNIQGTINDNNSTGTNSFTGAVFVANTGVFTNAATSTSVFNFSNGLSGDANAVVNLDGTGAKLFRDNNQTIYLQNSNKENAATLVHINNLQIQAGITLQNNGYLQVNNITRSATPAGVATFINHIGAVLYTYSDVTPFTDVNVIYNFTSFANTVNYNRNNGNQNIRNINYHNLVISNYGNSADRTKLLTGNTTINGKLIIEGNCSTLPNTRAILQIGAFNLTVLDSTLINCFGRITDNNATGAVSLQNVVLSGTNAEYNYNSGSNHIINGTMTVLAGGLVLDDNTAGTGNQINKLYIASGGDFDIQNNNITFNDTVTVGGLLRNTAASGSIIFGGLLYVIPGGSYTNTANQAVVFRRGIHYLGTTFNSGTGLHTFNTNAQEIKGKAFTISGGVTTTVKLRIRDTLTIGGVININVADSIINHGVVTHTNESNPSLNASVAAARWHQMPGSVFNFFGQSMFTTTGQLSAAAAGNEVNYARSGGDQNIWPATYFNLRISNSSPTNDRTKLLINNTTALGKVWVQGNCVAGRRAILQLATFNFTVNDTLFALCFSRVTDNSVNGVVNLQTVVVDGSNAEYNYFDGSNHTANQNFIIRNGGIALDGGTLGNNNTINGNLIIGAGSTFGIDQNFITVNGKTFVSGTLRDLNAAGTCTFNDSLIVSNGGLMNYNSGNQIVANGPMRILNGGSVRDDNATGTNNTTNKVIIDAGGDFDIEQNNIQFNDTVFVAGLLRNSSFSGSIIYNGLLFVQPGGSYSNAGNEPVTFRRGIRYLGNTFSSGTGLHTFNTNTQSISGNAFIINASVAVNIKLNIIDTLTIGGNVTINVADSVRNFGVVNLTNNGTALNATIAAARWHQMPGSKLFYLGANMFTTNGQLSAAAPGNEVYYIGLISQTIHTPVASTYANLYAGGSLTKTTAANLDITETLNIIGGSATLDIGSFTINRTTVGGSFNVENGNTLIVRGLNNFPKNYATYNLASNSTVIYNRTPATAAQNIDGVTYGNLSFANNDINAIKNATGNITVNGTLTLNGVNGGRFVLNGFTLTFGSSASVSGTVNNNNFIDIGSGGVVRRNFDAPGSFNYPIGYSATLREAFVNLNTATFTGTPGSRFIGVATVASAAPNQVSTEYSLQRHFVVSSNNISNVSGRFRFSYLPADVPPAVTPTIEAAWVTGFWNGSAWALSTTSEVNATLDTAAYLFSATPNISGNYTTALPASFIKQTFYSRASGNWEDGTTWSTVSHTGPASVTQPLNNSNVFVGNSHTVTITTAPARNMDTVNVYNGGRLELGTFNNLTINRLIKTAGAGTIATQAVAGDTARLPIINLSAPFYTTPNNTVEYMGTANYFLPRVSSYNNLSISGTGIKTQTINITMNGNLNLLAGTTLRMEEFSITGSGNSCLLAAGATLRVGNPALATATIFPNGFTTYGLNATSNVRYAANGNQTIRTLTYGNLFLETAGNKTPVGNFTINGNLTINAGATFNFGTPARTITVVGNLSGAGTLNMANDNHVINLRGANNSIGNFVTSATNSYVIYDGNIDQEIFPSPNYRFLRTASSGFKTPSGTGFTAALGTEVFGSSILRINTNNFKANCAQLTVTPNARFIMTGQGIRVVTNNLVANGTVNISPVFNSPGADTLDILGSLTVGSLPTSQFNVNPFGGTTPGSGTMRITINGNFVNGDSVLIADNTQIFFNGNWTNNHFVNWLLVAGTRYPIVHFIRNTGTQTVNNGLSFNNFPDVNINLGPTAKVELLRDMRVGRHFTLTSGRFFCGQEIGGSQNLLVTGDWRSNGGQFFAKNATVFLEGAEPTLIGTTAGTPQRNATRFYNLSITKTGGGPSRIVQNTNNPSIFVEVQNNLSVLSGTYRVRNRTTATSDTDLVVRGNIFIANGACMDITAGSTGTALLAEAADIHVYLQGDLTDQNDDANTFGNNSNGLWMGTINGNTTITNKPTLHICGVNTTQTITGMAANNGSRGGAFTGISLPNVEIDGQNTVFRMGSAVRIRGYARIRNTNRLVAAGALYGYYGLLLNDGAILTSPPSDYFVTLRVDAGGTFEAEAGANIFLHPQSKILTDAGSNLIMLGTITNPISFIRDGTASGVRHSHEYNGNISARFVRYQVGDAGGNSHLTTTVCGGSRAACVHIGTSAVLAPFPNNFSNSDFASIGPTLGLRIDAPLTVGVNDTITGVNFGGNTDTWNCHRVGTSTVPVVFKNSGGLRGGAIFGPTWECDSGGAAPLANRAAYGKVRWTSTSTLRWTGDISTNWHDPLNWIPNQIPTRKDIVVIPSNRYRYPSLTANAVAGQLLLGLSPSSDPLVPPVVSPIPPASIHLNTRTLDVIGDSINVLGDVEIGNITSATGPFINMGTGRLRLQGNLIFRQAVTVGFMDTVRGIRPANGTLEFYAGRNVIIGMAASNTDPPGLYNLPTLEIDKNTAQLGFNCGAKMLVEDLVLKSGIFRHGTCIDASPLYIKGNMNISNGTFHDNRGEIIQFISRNKTPKIIRTGGNVYQRIHFTGGVGRRYIMQDSLSVNTTAAAILLMNNGDTLITNGNTIIARNITLNNAVSNNALLRVDANGALLINNGGSINIGANTSVELVGSALGFASVNCLQTTGSYAFTVNGTIRARNYIIERLNADGLNIANGTVDPTFTNNLSFGIFDYGAQRAPSSPGGPARYITLNTTTIPINYNFQDVAFANTSNRTVYRSSTPGGTPCLANVVASNLSSPATNRYTFTNSAGSLGGVLAHENEIDNPVFGAATGYIRWVKPAIRWQGPSGGNWNVASNWTTGTVPTKNDNVVLSHSHRAGAYVVNITGAKAVCRSLLIINSSEGTTNALGAITLNVNNNDLEVKQEISLSSGTESIINLSANRTITVGTSIYNSGVFNAADNSTVVYHGDGTRQLGVNNFFNLTITDSAANNIYLMSDATLVRGTLTIGSNSKLDVSSNNYSLTLRGNYRPNGEFRYRRGAVTFSGLGNQFVQNHAEFNRLIINKPTGSVINKNHKIRVNELLFMQQGNIRTSWPNYPKDPTESDTTGEVEIGEDGDIAIASSNSFVDGRLTYHYRSSTLPVLKNYYIGKQNAGGYTLVPLRVRLTASVPTRIRGEVFTFYSGATLPFTATGNYKDCPTANTGWGYNIDHFSGIRYWQFDKLDPTGVDSARITLPWNLDDKALVPTNLCIVKGNGLCVEKLNVNMNEGVGSPAAGVITSSINFTTFSPFSFATELSVFENPLPLDLVKFTGTHQAVQRQNQLSWTTVNETNTSHFEVERSADGINFSQIGAIGAKNKKSTPEQYVFIDKNPLSTAYYRLKIVDHDRSYKYSQVVKITADVIDEESQLVALYPNPSSGKFYVQTTGQGVVQVYSLTGKIMMNKAIHQAGKYEIDATDWSKGIYIVEWLTQAGRNTKKLILD